MVASMVKKNIADQRRDILSYLFKTVAVEHLVLLYVHILNLYKISTDVIRSSEMRW